MSDHTVNITSPIAVDETPDVQDTPLKDEIDVVDGLGIPILSDLYTTWGTPENLAYKANMIETPQGVTTLRWAVNEAGGDVVNVDSGMKALDPVSNSYETVILNYAPGDDNILIGTTETGENVAFIAVIVEAADGLSADVYLLDYLPKEHSLGGENHDDVFTLDSLWVHVSVDQSVDFDFDGAPSGNNVFMAFGDPTVPYDPSNPDDPDRVSIVVTGRTVGEEVNSSHAGSEPTSLAANSNNINAGEGLAITYVKGMVGDFLVPNLSGPEASDPNNIQFDTLQTATQASVTIVKVGPSDTTATVRLTALSTEKELGSDFIPGIGILGDPGDNDTEIPITAVWVNDTLLTPVDYTYDGNTVVITGIINNDVITFETTLDHNRFLVANGGTGNARFNVGDVAIEDIDVQTDADPVTLEFYDDGPKIDLALGEGELQTDDGALPGGNAGGTTTDIEGLGSLFTVVAAGTGTGADDAGDGDDIVYTLELGANTSPGLVDTATGNLVFLFEESGDIVGREGTNATDAETGDEVFRLAVDGGTGAVTLTQSRAVEHDTADTADYPTDTTGLGGADAVYLRGTISDDESAADTATDAIDISGKISFTDDGPKIDLALGEGELQTDDGALPGGNAGGTTTDIEGLGSLFTVVAAGTGTGADDAGDGDDIVYTLELGANTSPGLVDTATGNLVFLFEESGDIVGREGTDATDAATGEEVIRLAVDDSTGAVTLTQSRAVVHSTPDTSGYATDITGLGGADAVYLRGTISDDETNADTATDAIDISEKIFFTDDGPKIDLALGEGELQTDDGDLAGGNTGDGTGTDSDTQGLGDLFTVEASGTGTGADDAGDGDDIVYTLELGANTSPGLVDTATGNTVFLFDESGDIVGREGTDATDAATGEEVIRLAVDDSTGAVTLTQSRAVVHSTPDTSGYATDITGLGGADAVYLRGTISDDETNADTATDAIDISEKIFFTDDGPKIDLELGTETLQTDDGDLAGGNTGDGTGTDSDTQGLGDLFTVVAAGTGTGADDAGDGDDIVYTLELGANTSPGLVDTATGNTVFLFDESGDIVGREGTDATDAATGEEVIRLAVDDSTGAVTLTQSRAVVHSTPDTSGYATDITGLGGADAVYLRGTISDDETNADTATDAIDISEKIFFTDDGPKIDLALGEGELQTDDGALPGGNAGGTTTDIEGLGSLFTVEASGTGTGADDAGDGDDIAYTLELGANAAAVTLVDTATGNTVFLFEESGDIVGREGTNAIDAETGNEVFRLAVDGGTGAVTLTQSRAVEHYTINTASPYNGDKTGLGVTDAIRLVGTISDDETAADTATDFIDISEKILFTDDGPAITGLDDTEILQFFAGESDSDAGFLSYGADGERDFVITGFDFTPLGETSLGTISGSLSPDGTVLTLSSDLIVEGGGQFGDFFQITLDGSGTGSYTAQVLQDKPILELALIEDTTTPGGPVEHIDLPEGDPIVTLDGFLFTDPNDTSDLMTTYEDGDKDLSRDPSLTAQELAADDINISNKGGALKDQQFDAGEGLALLFNDGVAGVRFIVDGGTGSPGSMLTIKMAGYDESGNPVRDKDGNFVTEVTFPLPKGNALQEVVFEAEEGEEISQLILIHDATDNGFRIPEIYAFTFADIPDIEGTVTVEATDGDFDEAADTFAFFIDGDGSEAIDPGIVIA
ncbi:DUF5801 repeats-in-toxin domain-containing protein [Halomonas aquatica]|uniref:DUF5801 repeats-in-toxin domain-containing protein n=1 Tax=Halomonas aquatica TaxID=3151123 RepID=A0ABV1NCG8_9GAMM